jgi:SepF-like predicted cell division protein (DUF552 family)
VLIEEVGEVEDETPQEEEVEEGKIKNQCTITSVTNLDSIKTNVLNGNMLISLKLMMTTLQEKCDLASKILASENF